MELVSYTDLGLAGAEAEALWIVKAEFEVVEFETPRGQVDVALLVTATIASNTVA